MARKSAWMQSKLDKMRRDNAKRNPPATDPNALPSARPRQGHTLERANVLASELATLVSSYKGVVTVCEPGRETNTWRKRGGSVLGTGVTRNTNIVYGLTQGRGSMRSVLTPDVYVQESRLIAKGAR